MLITRAYNFPETVEGLTLLTGRTPTSADYLRLCYQYAEVFSHDTKTRNGAVLVAAGRLFYGANRFPDGIEFREELLVPDIKDELIVHAERSCLFAAARAGVSPVGATMFCCWAPCVSCVSAILDTGVEELVVHKQMHDRTYEKYRASIARAVGYLLDGNRGYSRYDGPIGGCTGRIANEDWLP